MNTGQFGASPVPGRLMPMLAAFDFFFQAEDGIRDGRVTGVQTCALPIFRTLSSLLAPGQGATQCGSHRRCATAWKNTLATWVGSLIWYACPPVAPAMRCN